MGQYAVGSFTLITGSARALIPLVVAPAAPLTSWSCGCEERKHHLALAQRLAAQEKTLIEAALRETRGRVFGPSGAAAKLGMPRSTMESKIRSLKINKHRFRT